MKIEQRNIYMRRFSHCSIIAPISKTDSQPNFMRNEIIIPIILAMALFKAFHQKVYISVNKVLTQRR